MNMDGLKEKINWYRHLFTFSAAINFACVGWFVSNYNKAAKSFLIIDVFFVVFSLIGIIVLVYKIKKHIKNLGEN